MGADTAGLNLADRFLAVAARSPDREAVVVVGNEPVRLTYSALVERVERLAAALRDRGVRSNDRVGVLLGNGNEHLETLLASFFLRAVPVNISYRDVRGEVQSVLDSSGATLLVHEPDLGPLLPSSIARGPDYEAALRDAGPPPERVGRSGDDDYLLYSGGSSGRPKGVLWRHDDLFRGALAAAGEEGAAVRAARCYPASPFAHGTGQWMALSTLLHGGTVVCRRDRNLDADAVLDAVEAERVSFLVVVGDAFARPLVAALRARRPPPCLTTVLSGGAVLSPGSKRDLLRLLPTALIIDGFGASETGGQGRMISVAGAIPSGPPRFVVDDDTTVLAAGCDGIGLLARRGPIPRGYDGDHDATLIAFPTIDGTRWAIPGDRARVESDGTITVLGRGTSTISTGGHKVQAEEIEQALRSHPGVFDAIVVGVPDGRFGERVAAVVAQRHDADLTLDILTRHLRHRLAGHKVPRQLVLVDEVRRSEAGKPDYAWAREVAVG